MTTKIRRTDELSALEKLALIDISYSRLSTYEDCNGKYFHTYIEKAPREFGAAATLGNIVHSVLETLVGEEHTLPDLVMEMDEQREKWDPDHLIEPELIDAGYEMLSEYYDRHGKEEVKLLGKEFPFDLVIGSARINGYIDQVFDERDRIRICDLKTGKWEIRGEPKDDLQLGMYALALHTYFPDRPIYAELYYLRSGRHKGHLFGEEDYERIYNRVLALVQKIITSTHFQYTNEQWRCKMCDHAKNGACVKMGRR